MNFLQTARRVIAAPDLRKKISLTLLLLLAFRLIAHIPIPNVDRASLANFFDSNQFFGLLDVFSGGSLARLSLAAMGVNPYINASIIMQLLTIILPKLEEMQKDGERGRHKINQITRYLTVPLALIQAFGLVLLFRSEQGGAVLIGLSSVEVVQTILALAAGAVLLMWIGELITEYGIGNGISLIIFAGIVGGLPSGIQSLTLQAQSGNFLPLIVLAVFGLAAIYFVVYVNEANREIPVTYAKRIRGNRMYGGANTHIPLKVNTAGVIPIIFALSIMSFPTLVANFFTASESTTIRNIATTVAKVFDPTSAVYYGVYFILVIGFTYFYTLIAFNPQDVAENLRKQGGFIPGIRPGEATVRYLGRILNRITLAGAFFLGLLAVLPFVIESFTNVSAIIGGTSLLILVSVIIETMRQLEAQLVMRDYETMLDR